MRTIRWTKEAVKGVLACFKDLRSTSACPADEFAKGFRKMLEAIYGADAVARLLSKIDYAGRKVSSLGAEWYIICTSMVAGDFWRAMASCGRFK